MLWRPRAEKVTSFRQQTSQGTILLSACRLLKSWLGEPTAESFSHRIGADWI
jgi:hypothetical protein